MARVSTLLCLAVGIVAPACSVYDQALLVDAPAADSGVAPDAHGPDVVTLDTAGGSDAADANDLSDSADAGALSDVADASDTDTTDATDGPPACTAAADCPTPPSACQAAACTDGGCGFDPLPASTTLSDLTAGDCKRPACDGQGAMVKVIDDSDADDGNECTADGCGGGVPTHTAQPGKSCGVLGGVCNAAGACVECATNADCPSGVCTAAFECAAPTCNDGVKNGVETDTDCGGATCAPCPIGKGCTVAADCDATNDNTCRTHACTNAACAFDFAPAHSPVTDPTPGDCKKSECDGSGAIVSVPDDGDKPLSTTKCVVWTCAGGAATQSFAPTGTACNDSAGALCNGSGLCVQCNTAADCGDHAACIGDECVTSLVISEFRSRGPSAGNDDFIELYNPSTAPVTLDSRWQLRARSDAALSYDAPAKRRWVGNGQVLGAHGHYLIGGSSYSGATTKDATLTTGITDSGSIILEHGDDPVNPALIDAVCYYRGDAAKATIEGGAGYLCEGALVENPHTATNTDDKSLERKPGGAAGNGQDTGDSATDFAVSMPSNPQNLASPATPP